MPQIERYRGRVEERGERKGKKPDVRKIVIKYVRSQT